LPTIAALVLAPAFVTLRTVSALLAGEPALLECVYGRLPQILDNLLTKGKAVPMIVVVPDADALPVDTTSPTIQVLLFARPWLSVLRVRGDPTYRR
jgi:hypothetical protein